MSQRRAVITGIGPITCIGHGRENFWNGILREKSGINTITSFDPTVFRVRSAGEIGDWDPEKYFSPQRLKRLDRYAQFAVVSAKLAIDDAQLECSREKPQDRVGVSFGTALGGVCKAEEQYLRYLKKALAAFNLRSPFRYSAVRPTRISRSSSDFVASERQIRTVAPVELYRSAKRCVTSGTILRT